MISSRCILALHAFLQRLDASYITAIEVKPEHSSELYDPAYMGGVFSDAFKTIAEKWPGLLRFGMYYRCPLAAPHIVVWQLGEFASLFKCTQMKSFIVNVEPFVVIQDEHVNELVRAWPDLEVLVVGSLMTSVTHYSSLMRALSYESFILLSTSPFLRTLMLNICPLGQEPEDSALLHLPREKSHLETVIIRDPEQDEAQDFVLRFLRALLPTLTFKLQGECPRCNFDSRLHKVDHWIFERTPVCCIRDVAERLGIPGMHGCVAKTRLQRKIEGECILCQMDLVSNFETFAEWSNMYG
ncbi:hypothetical protein DACRYDRAFT_23086 [Dacryopinax primogenitus]|uniref:Uncharacterized protein n=1 Tax=Dacryopinax primogenitus (strain DJM 731) TaxID=1858805 RepID=M5G4I1_DACPD|nr:uncharacterized protein DACRYDRAFT_23086 [Dacryopinax primogenitus]EJU00732.1 hypothetical protein DACRYDRAFT_23086 [Dacryopinax primogenitus]